MTLNRVLALTSVALGALLVIQVVFAPRLILRASDGKPPAVRYMHASWVDNAATLKDGHAQSDHVILAEVVGLRKGPDLVVPAAGEPTGEDRIPTTIVSLSVKKTYKGTAAGMVELMQTGHSTDALQVPAPADVSPIPAPGGSGSSGGRDGDNDNDVDHHGKGKGHQKGSRAAGMSTQSPPKPSAGDSSRATILEDDPPYQPGEKYVLFLKDMQPAPASALALAAVSPAMKRSLAPEGRYQVTKGDHLKPSTNRKGFAPNWKGRPLSDLESELAKQTTP